MGTYAKYEFNKVPPGFLKLPNADIVVCPPLVLVEAVTDDEGNIIIPAVLSDKVHIDVYWHNKPEKGNQGNRKFPIKPHHYIMGMEQEYLKTLAPDYTE